MVEWVPVFVARNRDDLPFLDPVIPEMRIAILDPVIPEMRIAILEPVIPEMRIALSGIHEKARLLVQRAGVGPGLRCTKPG